MAIDERLLKVKVSKTLYKEKLHWPGIEPGPPAWQARILPLNHQCLPLKNPACDRRTPGLVTNKKYKNIKSSPCPVESGD